MLGTPVLGARIGGIPELIRDGGTGELFQSGDARELEQKIRALWEHPERTAAYRENCKAMGFDTVADYAQKLLGIYAP